MSLRTRLLLAVGVVALASVVIADVVTYQQLRSFLYRGVDQSLESANTSVELAMTDPLPGKPPDGDDSRSSSHDSGGPLSTEGTFGPPATAPPPQGCSSFEDVTSQTTQGLQPGTFIEVRDPDNSVIYKCTLSAPGQVSPPPPVLPSRITGLTPNSSDQGELTAYFNAAATKGDRAAYRVRACVLSRGALAGSTLIVGAPLRPTLATLDHLLRVELAVTAAAILAALLLGWWLVRVGIRPLRSIERTAEAIAAGELDQRVPGDEANTEVGRLARALNVMLSRIERAFAQRDRTEGELRESESRMRQLVADASHELRTPLAAVSAYAELFERGASQRPEDLVRVMEGIRSETSRMGHLVDDLLLLARLDEGRPLERLPVELVEIAAESARTAATVAPLWPVRLEASQPVEVLGDRARLRQVIDNLLSNVRSHTPGETPSTIVVTQIGHDAVVTVTDEGPGLTPEAAAHVFERFYRADPSRSRSHGGSGLGLSIVSSIVHAHGGAVSVENADGGGARFTIRIPAAVAEGPPPQNVESRILSNL